MLPGLLQADPRPKDHKSNEPDTNPASPLEVPPSEADDTGLHDVQIDEARKQDGPGGGGRRARDSGKNEQHGGGPKELEKIKRQIKQLDEQIEIAVGANKKQFIKTRRNVIENSRKKARGENHIQSRKGR